MLRRILKRLKDQRGDTLVEVTFALGIMSTVLVSATLLTIHAFNLGITARERTQLVNAAIEQAEALRSYRDVMTMNGSWAAFTQGITGANGTECNLENASETLPCFIMSSGVTGSVGQWAPIAYGLGAPHNGNPSSPTVSLPDGSNIEIYDVTSSSAKIANTGPAGCAVRLEVRYASPAPGGGPDQKGVITLELVNPRYPSGSNYATDCQP